MIDNIDNKIVMLLKHRDSDYVKKYPELRAWICDTIGHCYSLESCMLLSNQKLNAYSANFFTAKTAVNRHYRDWGLDEVADIYNELCTIAEPYLEN
ncbi:MAG TPA: hypothetical protein VEY10_03695 [Flavisolibacter sp.]|jgi:hypothetical protein|nr:hypothetical protein [Flavisolibacter sp.]